MRNFDNYTREEIENIFKTVHRSEDGIYGLTESYFRTSVLDNQSTLLEVLLDIRDLLNKHFNK